MPFSDLTSIQFYQKKRNVLLYKASLAGKRVLLKCTSLGKPSDREAFMDEYKALKGLSHPGIPAYYWLREPFYLPDQREPFLVLCMEDCSKTPAVTTSELSLPEIIAVLRQVCTIISWLLEHGILYTDLNPTNLILHRHDNSISVSLVDYTYCYFFLENPYPHYSLRFSYNLSPSLKGQQLLIQELSFLLQELLDNREDILIPSRIYRLMETGMNPSEHLSLSDYSAMLDNILVHAPQGQ